MDSSCLELTLESECRATCTPWYLSLCTTGILGWIILVARCWPVIRRCLAASPAFTLPSPPQSPDIVRFGEGVHNHPGFEPLVYLYMILPSWQDLRPPLQAHLPVVRQPALSAVGHSSGADVRS